MTSDEQVTKPDRLCKLCGAPLKFAKTPAGKTIPLDLRAPVYDLIGASIAARSALAYVSHFATCPRANEASSRKRTEPGQQEQH